MVVIPKSEEQSKRNKTNPKSKLLFFSQKHFFQFQVDLPSTGWVRKVKSRKVKGKGNSVNVHGVALEPSLPEVCVLFTTGPSVSQLRAQVLPQDFHPFPGIDPQSPIFHVFRVPLVLFRCVLAVTWWEDWLSETLESNSQQCFSGTTGYWLCLPIKKIPSYY